MRNLASPSNADVRQHLEIALAEYQYGGVNHGYPATAQDLDNVELLYEHYDAERGAPQPLLQGPELAEGLKDEIREGYRFIQEGAKLGSIRALLMGSVRQCPICGISPPTELDHYLPRANYRPLAIYVRNLVPSCHQCNHRKGAYVGQNPQSRFVHPYLDNLPAVQFLTAAISLANGGLDVEFSIGAAPGLDDILLARLQHQFERLQLNARYARELNDYLVGHTISLHTAFRAEGVDGVRAFLLQQAATERRYFHLNHWRPVLLQALAGHDGFCDGGFADVLLVPEEHGVIVDAAG